MKKICALISMVFFCSYSLYGGEIFIATSYLEELRGSYALISSKGNADLQQLSSPFQMENIEWRLLNNTVEILQYIKRD